MKNREKFRDEIIKNARNTSERINICEFFRINVLPHFGDGGCDSVNCAWCNTLFRLWLDEEYEEPPKPEVDWSKVPVDTLVRVKDDEEDTWALRYFCGWSENENYGKYRIFPNGTTSKTTTSNYTEYWMYCELVEEEIDQLLKGGDVIDH